MAVNSVRFTQYYVQCDGCGIEDVVADNKTEGVYSKQKAIQWANMHKIKDSRILCDTCYQQYKNKTL